jgi:2,4-didehydro-3-deoxy-L-rhamnonate hydrolase
MRSDRIVLAQARGPGSQDGGRSAPWLVLGDRTLALRRWAHATPVGEFSSLTSLVEQWSAHKEALHSLTTSPEVENLLRVEGAELATLDLEAPIHPRQVFCTIGNYHRQVVQAAVDADDGPSGAGASQRRAQAVDTLRRRRDSGDPYICLTSPGRVASPASVLPITDSTVDWEVEIAAVVAAVPRNVDPSRASELIAGYCTANDVTVRTKVTRADLPAMGSDWLQSKGLPGSLPLGPWFVPAWQVPDLDSLRLRLWVNDELMQDDLAGDMVFSAAEQVAYLSRHLRVEPGDVICTGSPAGFGSHHGRYLQPGDVMVAEVAGLGAQQVRCVGADLTARERTT